MVEHMAVRQSDGLVVAGTHGNGIYSARFPVIQKDLALEAVLTSNTTLFSNAEVVSVKVTNLGVDDISFFQLKYALDGVEQQSATITTEILASGESYLHDFTQPLDLSESGFYSLTASLVVVGDGNNTNDILEKELVSFPYIQDYPYKASFENGNGGWQSTGLWELGVPNDGILDRASEGLVAWGTNLNADYPSFTTAKLMSPVFDFSSINNPIVSFDLAYATEEDWDGMVLAYRTDLTSEKFKVIENGMGLSNWYDAYAEVFGYLAWTGTQSDFVEASANLDFLSGEPQVQFAFIFASDQLENDEGFLVDRFQVYENLSADNNIAISNREIAENLNANSFVGAFSTTVAIGAITYSFDTGEGALDNDAFDIIGDELRTGTKYDYEEKNKFVIRIKGEDEASNLFHSVFYINIKDTNDPLMGLSLSNKLVVENSPAGTTVGTLSAIDEDVAEVYSMNLVSGDGSEDNSNFGVLGNELRTSKKFDFETKNSYSIRVRARSSANSSAVDSVFLITIVDDNDVPTNLLLSDRKIPDFEPAGYLVGAFSATDGDGDMLTYALTSGAGGEDNAQFIVQGTDLITQEGADFSVQPKYRVRVETSDGRGGFLVSPFEISVQELLGLLELGKMGVTLSPNPTSDYLNIKIANKMIASGYLSISTMEGRELQRFDFSKNAFVFKERLDLSDLSHGVYMLKVQLGDRSARGRVVKY